MKTLKEILISLNIDEETVNSVTDEEFYSREEFTQMKNDYEKKLNLSEIDRIVDSALAKCGAKNNLAVKALLNLEDAQIEKNTIKGLTEQLNKIKSENSYLFSSSDSKTAGSHTSFTSNDFDAMTDEQYYSINYRKEN